MGSLQQATVVGGGSNRIAAVEESPPPSSNRFTHNRPQDIIMQLDHQEKHNKKPGWIEFFAYVGPGCLVSVAYLDPGNLMTDLQAGAKNQYELLWLVLVGLIFALVIQSLAANLGVCTGKHLAELCREEYPKYATYGLWLLAEVAVIAADIPEVVGTASALNLLIHLPIWGGVLCTGLSTLLLLGVQRYGARKLELLIAMLVLLMAACFFGELGIVKPPAKDVFKGMFVPRLKGQGATGDAIALLGAIVTPHNLFLHSALVLSRKVPNSTTAINDACRYFLIETGFALFVAFLINAAIVSVSGAICSNENLSASASEGCNNLSLNSASLLLKSVLGKSSSIVYAIALLASGQSSTITGTYAGQFIMQGFLNLKTKKWTTNLITRSVAIAPSLIASILGGASGAGQLIIVASMILSFQLPFTLIPLLKFSGSSPKMGPYTNSIYIIVFSWILLLATIVINIYFLGTAFVNWLIHNNLPKAGNVVVGILVFPLMAIYIFALIYLILRKDRVVTFIEPSNESQMENGNNNNSAAENVTHREDLASVLFPE